MRPTRPRIRHEPCPHRGEEWLSSSAQISVLKRRRRAVGPSSKDALRPGSSRAWRPRRGTGAGARTGGGDRPWRRAGRRRKGAGSVNNPLLPSIARLRPHSGASLCLYERLLLPSPNPRPTEPRRPRPLACATQCRAWRRPARGPAREAASKLLKPALLRASQRSLGAANVRFSFSNISISFAREAANRERPRQGCPEAKTGRRA
jgi:hypothetical protein